MSAAATVQWTDRQYQLDALAKIEEQLQHVNSTILALPTGTGKTHVFVELVNRYVHAGKRAIILVHADELLQQTIRSLSRSRLAKDVEIGVVNAAQKEFDKPLIVASIQTLTKPENLQKITCDFALVVADEAHHATARTWRRVLMGLGCPVKSAMSLPAVERLEGLATGRFVEHPSAGGRVYDSRALPALLDRPHVKLLGATATAYRHDRVSLGHLFDSVAYERSIVDMICEGWLCDLPPAYRVHLAVDLNRLYNSKTHKVDDGEAGEMLMNCDAPAEIVKAFLVVPEAQGRKTICFTPTIQVAHAIAKAFQAVGLKSEAVDGEMPMSQRRAILRRLASGETQIVPNAAVLVEGFDQPDISCLIIAKPTSSQTAYAQMLGRGLRTFPGKTDCLVFDCVGTTEGKNLVTLATLEGLKLQPGKVTVKQRRIREEEQEKARQAHEAETVVKRRIIERIEFDRRLERRRTSQWAIAQKQELFVVSIPRLDGEKWKPYRRLAIWKESRSEGYTLLHLDAKHKYMKVVEDTSLEQAQLEAEKLLAKYQQDSPEFARLLDEGARWKDKEPTPAQIEEAQRLGLRYPEDIRRGAIGKLITLEKERRYRPRYSKYKPIKKGANR
jgi:superfamily II DNA or RNA helicase